MRSRTRLQAALFHLAGLDPAVGERDQPRPVGFEGHLDFEADHAVVEVAQAGVGGFAGGQTGWARTSSSTGGRSKRT